MIARVIPWLAIVALTGCAGAQEARVAARAVLGETLQYERLVDRKIVAEQTYYANRETSLAGALDRARAAAEAADVATMSDRVAAHFVKRPQPLTSTDLLDFVTGFLRDRESALEETHRKRQELRVLVTESLAPLELDKAALQRLRKSLEALQVAPAEAAQLRDVYDFLGATRAAYDKLRTEDAKDAK